MKLAVALGLAAILEMIATASAQIEPFLSANVVKIGVLTDMSSLYADIGGSGSVEAARMAIADFGGTVNGKKIELVSADHHNNPDLGAAIANQWFGYYNADAIVDVPTSSVALAVQEVAHSRNKVFLISGAAASDLTGNACSPTSVHWTYDTVALANGTGGAVVRSGGDTWFFVTANYAFGIDLERDTSKVIKQNGGSVVGSIRAPLGTVDFSPFLSGSGLEGKDHWSCQCWRRHDQLDQTGGKVRHGRGRTEACCDAPLHFRRPQPRAADRARAAADVSLLLGPRRRYPSLVEALF